MPPCLFCLSSICLRILSSSVWEAIVSFSLHKIMHPMYSETSSTAQCGNISNFGLVARYSPLEAALVWYTFMIDARIFASHSWQARVFSCKQASMHAMYVRTSSIFRYGHNTLAYDLVARYSIRSATTQSGLGNLRAGTCVPFWIKERLTLRNLPPQGRYAS
jgi:hypothetical protein